MSGYWPILKRELFSFFVTPLAWVLVFVFVVLQGLHFGLLIDHFATVTEITTDQSPLQAFFGNTVLLYVVLFLLVPPITMGSFAEERRSGTAETLLTAPVGSVGVVLAKYTAALVAYAAGNADAALAASIFHDGQHTVGEAKKYLRQHGVLVRGGDA